MNEKATRRVLLGTIGAGTLGATAGCLDSLAGDEDDGSDEDDGNGSNGDDATQSDERDDTDEQEEETEDVPDIDGGAVVFTYDDGPMEDYEQAFPVHQEFDAPASAGIVTEWVGREDFNDNDWMDVEHLEELAEAGWEINSHTTAHTALGEFELVEDVEPDDTRVYPEERNHGFHLEYDIEITDGENSVVRTVVASDSDEIGGYLEFDEPIGESFAAGETVERYPEELMHEFLGDSKAQLEEWGFEVDTLLAPYDVCDEWTIEFASEYYDGIANVNPGSMLNDREEFDPFDTHRDYFIEFTDPLDIQEQLDEVAAQDAIGIVGAHTFKDEVDEDGIREMLEWVEERDLTVITLTDAITAATSDSV
ncbi:polysaccharide deacetylase family protein [Natronococcus sp. A-GB1]|uniref:polysaccharide deacetylase family protein n=1 Tax=Natronococcus sp. A-GB1 TaxID=3037648 RepID=UPI00241E4D53|nr:polysaccharide deacetylase family protein [Natronococcus sp. A-GB1]MDG5758512.1 polysaccharide deacetylase family protein [Natronococcus sp. A-GB1]